MDVLCQHKIFLQMFVFLPVQLGFGHVCLSAHPAAPSQKQLLVAMCLHTSFRVTPSLCIGGSHWEEGQLFQLLSVFCGLP